MSQFSDKDRQEIGEESWLRIFLISAVVFGLVSGSLITLFLWALRSL